MNTSRVLPRRSGRGLIPNSPAAPAAEKGRAKVLDESSISVPTMRPIRLISMPMSAKFCIMPFFGSHGAANLISNLAMPQTWKRAIVVGASSGNRGGSGSRFDVADGCRSRTGCPPRGDIYRHLPKLLNDKADSELAFAYANDVTDISSVPPIFDQITRDLGGLDLIIYAAGIMPRVGPDEYNTAKDAEIIAANFTGAIAWLNEAAKRFEIAKSGTIIGISSVAGDRGRRGNPVYGATKAASQCLFGITAKPDRAARRLCRDNQARPGGYADD